MNFHIAETPTLHAVAVSDEHRLAQDLQSRVDEALCQADERAEVVEAAGAHDAAVNHLRRLRAAERALHQHARESREQMAALSQTALNGIIASAADAGKPEFAKLTDLTRIEMQSRYASRALEHLVEHLIPLAEITRLREESHALITRARAMEQIAQERAERILGQLRDAVSEEIVLPIDMSKGVAGALLARAGELKNLALQQSRNADELEKSYLDQKGKH